MIELKGEKLQRGSRAYPVFITSDEVTPQLVNTFLRELAKRHGNKADNKDYWSEYYIVTKQSLPEKHKIDEACISDALWPTPFPESASSPYPDFDPVPEFLDASVEKLDEAFKLYFEIAPFARYSYVVLDARSVEDGITCFIRNIGTRFNPAQARCLFKLVAEIFSGPETPLGYNFNDFREKGPKFRDPWGQELYYYDDSNWRYGGP